LVTTRREKENKREKERGGGGETEKESKSERGRDGAWMTKRVGAREGWGTESDSISCASDSLVSVVVDTRREKENNIERKRERRRWREIE
jgi:hypothetical protein